ncbi:MAG: phosphopyruvate hydratase [Acidimicrobiia bacterium]|nr:phosphopyruvate hydratase [Acidimicrobiia bacterium]
MKTAIASVRGRRIWDSRGRPTVEAEIELEGGARGRAIAPSGASTGSAEARDRRDGGQAFGGLDVTGALAAVNGEIAKALVGCDAADQEGLDRSLIALDGTKDKSRLGGNALIAVSMAAAHAAAAAEGVPLWRYLAGSRECRLPLPEIQIFGGGAHAGQRVDVQDFMVIAVGADDYVQALDWTAEVYRAAGALMADAGLLQGVADEGGFWPAFANNEAAIEMTVRAIKRAGFTPGRDLALSLDIAASQFGRGGRYRLARDGRELSSNELAETLLGWLARYPIVAIEDPLAEDDLDGLARFTRKAGPRVQVVGDDCLVTSAERIRAAAARGACNATLLKPNQAGTLTEAKEALAAARAAGWGAIVSARSGETEDATIVHLAVGWGVDQLKVGSFSRSERMAKWNEGLRIADLLGRADLPPRTSFPWRKN